MAKTNFTKAEEALAEALQKMTVDKLYEATESPQEIDLTKGKKSLNTIQRHLKRLHKEDPEIYKKFNVKRKKLAEWIEHPEKIKSEEWKTIDLITTAIEAYIKEKMSSEKSTDANIIEQERLKTINKRFNTNEKWLPLK